MANKQAFVGAAAAAAFFIRLIAGLHDNWYWNERELRHRKRDSFIVLIKSSLSRRNIHSGFA